MGYKFFPIELQPFPRTGIREDFKLLLCIALYVQCMNVPNGGLFSFHCESRRFMKIMSPCVYGYVVISALLRICNCQENILNSIYM